MSTSSHTAPRPTAFHRVLAGLLASLVFLLGVAHVSPDAHAWVHSSPNVSHAGCDEHEHKNPAPAGHRDHVCAIELFAYGAEIAPLGSTLPPATLVWHYPAAAPGDELLLSPPRYLRQPERGPPAD